MTELDRMLADNQNSTRMNQAKQIAKSTAEVALLAVGIHGKAILSKAAGSIKTPLAKTVLKNTSAEPLKKNLKAGYDTLYEVGKKKLKDPKLLQTLGKGAEIVGKEGVARIKGEIKKQLPPEIAALQDISAGFTNTRELLKALHSPLPTEINGVINAVSKATLGKGDLTHGVIGYANKVLKSIAVPGKNSKYILAQLKGGEAQIDKMIGQTTAELLKDTKEMLENSEKDAEDEARSEEDIKRIRKA
ncbi:hypothetical protein [Candidatus Cryosericum septentrionale]|jgi:hypothetical protein|uniref:Uncharacterized protein n=1 Tax=Candidatus Cryosericum septentrionale TaxID=2290913 RepID=A0A398DSE5_9BACT|nr:hypothetical protein [Candidatus Cryosericum septentrionale]RIE16959.1 hypothetical protein SMC1_03905 [Candidatus Cryosericum septentrionale]